MSPEIQLAISLVALAVSVFAAGWSVFVFLSGRSKATRSQIEQLRRDHDKRLANHSERITRAEAEIEDKPTTNALHELAVSIAGLSGDLKAVIARLDGQGEIVRRLETVADRQEQYLLNSKGRK